MQLNITTYHDGENAPADLESIKTAWLVEWKKHYEQVATLKFDRHVNVKNTSASSNFPPLLKKITAIRNPDVYFVEESFKIELGGVEITDHSPDGSNVEKRYPFLWAAKKYGVSGFIVSPYAKERFSGSVNKLPYRHATLNKHHLQNWRPLVDVNGLIHQILPLKGMQLGSLRGMQNVYNVLPDWVDIGAFFAHTLAIKVFTGDTRLRGQQNLEEFRTKLRSLVDACLSATQHTEPRALIPSDERWIQVYNARPDTGHWERGEGQFDSIDGRLMFSLDYIETLAVDARPQKLEFWLPQMTSKHPWIIEQATGQSKRWRNITKVLNQYYTIKFSDDLSKEDWELLQRNQGALLERQDWPSNVYHVASLVSPEERNGVAVARLEKKQGQASEILKLLNNDKIYFSTHRPYSVDWQNSLRQAIESLNPGAVLLIPRIPKKLLANFPETPTITLVAAEKCTKLHLLMLRQLHLHWVKNKRDNLKKREVIHGQSRRSN